MGTLGLDNRAEEHGAMIVTCYIEGRGDAWEGVCLDFDLAVHGVSFREVNQKLDGAIHSYISYVKTLPEEDQRRLLNRHVPFVATIGFMARLFLSWVFRSRKDDGSHWNAYTVPCAT